jgi:sensor histidine kinase YesM
LFFVNLIGFFIGFFIDGAEIFEYWNRYIIYSSVIGMSLWLGNEYFAIYIDKKYTWLQYPARKLVLRLVFSLVYSTFIMMLLYMFIWFFIFHKPDLTNFFQYNRLSFLIFYAATLIVMLIYHSIAFFQSWQAAALNEEKLKKESISLQLQALRNQVDPHFLFNSFNTLTSLIEKEPKKAVVFVKQLSEMYRYMLDRDSREVIDIASELRFVESYVYLQQMRFGDNLKVEMNIQDRSFYVLPISVQMLIENAIKHNEVSSEFPLLVEVSDDPDFLKISNKIQPKMLETPSNGIGLQNLKVRYQFFTEKALEVEEHDGMFTVKIPKLND